METRTQVRLNEKMHEILHIILEMAPFILLGFLLAGFMHVFIPNAIYRQYLGGNSFRSVANATLLGIPLPLCSCGVIPTAMSLRKEGASKGATVAFIIATPQTGVDSIVATYSLMGLPYAVTRPIMAILTALFGGLFVNSFSKTDAPAATSTESCSPREEFRVIMKRGWRHNIKKALLYACVDMMQDIGKKLVVGLIVAGIITVIVPDSWFAVFRGNTLLSILAVLIISIPMYICATGSIPIAVALMSEGLSPGTALVLLMAGPAVNTASILVVGKVLGRRTMILYLISIIGGAILGALCVDYLLPAEWFLMPLHDIHLHDHEGMPWIKIAATILLVALLINALVLKRHRILHGEYCNCGYHGHGHGSHCACGDDHCECGDDLCECGHDHSAADDDENEALQPVLAVKIKGMMCNHCKANAERAILSITGVTAVDIDLASGSAIVHGISNPALIREAIEPLGFELATE